MQMQPFLKWAGGKRWLSSKLCELIGSPMEGRLVEPFVGGGAVFFALSPKAALLGDCNPDLISTYRVVKSAPEKLVDRLARMNIDRTTYEQVRANRPRSDLDRAVRLLYLNRTAFNGLYRVNKKGEFNVPFGCKPGTRLSNAEELLRASDLLSRATLVCQDFRKTLAQVEADDIVYVDPPYTVKHDNNGFVRYNDRIFSWEDQEDLAAMLVMHARKGGRALVSNAHHLAIRKLYPREWFQAFVVKRSTCIAADPNSRGRCSECLLVSAALVHSRSAARRKKCGAIR
jgi:DNA adenine methylase